MNDRIRLRDLKLHMENNPDVMRSLPEEPEEPFPSDCCGQSCVPCVFDLYYKERDIWMAECYDILQMRDKLENELPGDCNLANHESVSSYEFMVPDRYRGFQLTEIVQISEDTNLYKFKLSSNGFLNILPGQHLVLRCINKDCKPLTRQYTPIYVGKNTGCFELLIKLYDSGKMSNCMRCWQVGDEVLWRGPFGKYQYIANDVNVLLLYAAGTGIAPFVDIIESIVNNEDDETRIVLFYSCQKYDQILLKHQISAWKQFWNFKCTFALSKETDQNCGSYGDSILFKRIDLELITKSLAEIHALSFKTLICGTKSFTKDIVKYLSLNKVDRNLIFTF